MERRALVTGVLTALVLFASGPASVSAVTTVGSGLPASTGSAACTDASGRCTVTNDTINYNGAYVPAIGGYPGNGVVVRWRVRDATGTVRLRVLRRGPPGQSVISSSPTVTAAAPGVLTFDARIPVQAQDVLAVDVLGGTLGYVTHPAPPPGGNPYASSREWSPPLVDGAIVPPSMPGGPGAAFGQNVEALVNADVEADADGDGYGDETQDQCPKDAKLQTACSSDLAVSATATPATAAFGAKVTYTVTVTNLGSSPADAVLLTLSPPAGALLEPRLNCLGTIMGGSGITLPPAGFLGCKVVGAQILGSFGTVSAGATVGVVLRAVVASPGPIIVPGTATTSTTDPAPANNAASATATVTLKRGACANVLKGTRGPDVLTGTPAGDKLSGGLGADTLAGKAGADCLDGGGGADRIDGDSGKDTITGGPGKDKIRAGSGDDTVNVKDGFIDTVDCGAGRDTVKADRRDVLKRCEKRR